MRFTDKIQLTGKRETLPNGFVLFRDVSFARTGEQIYGPGETLIDPGPDGLVYIDRPEDQVFRRETLDSFSGMVFANEHPEDDVGPDNFRELIEGVVLNPRRGTGEQKDEAVCDVLVYSRQALQDIDSGKRELSGGYDADYFQTGEGRGEQRNILGNHVALVAAGRCGSRCALKDKAYEGALKMPKTSIKDRILAAFKAKDEEAVKKALDEMEEDPDEKEQHTHIHINAESKDKAKDEDPTEKRLKAIEDAIANLGKSRDAESEEEKKKKAEDEAKEKKDNDDKDEKTEDELAEEAPDGMEDKARKAKDSAYLADSFEQVKMNAEIIAPGVRIPTFDRAADPKKTFRDCLCELRRKALAQATTDAETAALINKVRGRATDAAAFKTMDSKVVRTTFAAVAALKAAHNDKSGAPSFTGRTKDSRNENQAERFATEAASYWNKK